MSNQDVDNYKQIKTDLDQLRLTVEKSELWVEKSSSYENGELGESQAKGSEEPIEVGLLARGLVSVVTAVIVGLRLIINKLKWYLHNGSGGALWRWRMNWLKKKLS